MARPYKEDTPESVRRRIARGFGKGKGKDYLPWLRVLDVPSQGKSSRLLGWKTGRVHHLLSSLETDYFYLLEWSDQVTDIREQFPIPVEDSTGIAEQLGVRHPYSGQHPMVMTTDFLITVDGVEYARTVKPSKELETERTIEKFAIEQRYWQSRSVDWKIVTEHELPKTLTRNIDYLHGKRSREVVRSLNDQQLEALEAKLGDDIQSNSDQPAATFTKLCDEMFNLGRGVSLSALRYFLANKVWTVDMDKPIEPNLPMALRERRALFPKSDE